MPIEGSAWSGLHTLIEDITNGEDQNVTAHALFWLTPNDRALGFWYSAESSEDQRDLARMLRWAADTLDAEGANDAALAEKETTP